MLNVSGGHEFVLKLKLYGAIAGSFVTLPGLCRHFFRNAKSPAAKPSPYETCKIGKLRKTRGNPFASVLEAALRVAAILAQKYRDRITSSVHPAAEKKMLEREKRNIPKTKQNGMNCLRLICFG